MGSLTAEAEREQEGLETCLHGRSVRLGDQLVLQPDELPQLGVLFKPVRQA